MLADGEHGDRTKCPCLKWPPESPPSFLFLLTAAVSLFAFLFSSIRFSLFPECCVLRDSNKPHTSLLRHAFSTSINIIIAPKNFTRFTSSQKSEENIFQFSLSKRKNREEGKEFLFYILQRGLL